jgi:hypothetical protein
MRRASVAISLVGAIVLAGCADARLPGDGGTASATRSSGPGSERLAVYEALIRHLVDPEGTQPVYILADLCFQLMEGEPRCPDRLDAMEQRDLAARLDDLGEIVFRSNDDPGPPPDEPFQEILLGPIVERHDGLRVEGGAVCGGLCGQGSVYILVPGPNGYEVAGTDDSFGSWIA